jgi:hypothetical protein
VFLGVLGVFVVIFGASIIHHKVTKTLSWNEKVIDAVAVLFYYHLNTGKEVIEKYMSSNHSEVAET